MLLLAFVSRLALGPRPASYPVGTGGPFSGGKAQLGHDADHSLPSSVKFKNK